MREALGLSRVEDFSDISSDPVTQLALFKAYGTVEDIDLWIGGLCEDPMAEKGSQLGPLFTYIVAEQFRMLRDHDRFWHQRDLTKAEYAMVKNTTLAKIIQRNTNIRPGEIPHNVFYVRKKRHHR